MGDSVGKIAKTLIDQQRQYRRALEARARNYFKTEDLAKKFLAVLDGGFPEIERLRRRAARDLLEVLSAAAMAPGSETRAAKSFGSQYPPRTRQGKWGWKFMTPDNHADLQQFVVEFAHTAVVAVSGPLRSIRLGAARRPGRGLRLLKAALDWRLFPLPTVGEESIVKWLRLIRRGKKLRKRPTPPEQPLPFVLPAGAIRLDRTGEVEAPSLTKAELSTICPPLRPARVIAALQESAAERKFRAIMALPRERRLRALDKFERQFRASVNGKVSMALPVE